MDKYSDAFKLMEVRENWSTPFLFRKMNYHACTVQRHCLLEFEIILRVDIKRNSSRNTYIYDRKGHSWILSNKSLWLKASKR